MQNAMPWYTYMNVLHDVVNYWQGEWLPQTIVWGQMKYNYFPTAEGINTYLLRDYPILDPILLDAIYTDPWYGL